MKHTCAYQLMSITLLMYTIQNRLGNFINISLHRNSRFVFSFSLKNPMEVFKTIRKAVTIRNTHVSISWTLFNEQVSKCNDVTMLHHSVAVLLISWLPFLLANRAIIKLLIEFAWNFYKNKSIIFMFHNVMMENIDKIIYSQFLIITLYKI